MTIAELYEVRYLREQFNCEFSRQRSLEAAIDGLTATFNGLPRPPNHSSRTERLAILIADTSEILRDLNERIADASIRLTEQIFKADLTAKERDVLILRYVRCLTFGQIANEMQVSRGYMFRIQSNALKKIIAR